MPASTYPGATSQDRSQFAGVTMPRVEKVLWHTTESAGWPAYPTFAPHLTVDPVLRQVRQHMPLNRSATTLADPVSTPVRENRDNVVQIEIVGYCDPARAASAKHIRKWGDAEYQFLAGIAAWFWREWGVPLTSTVDWVPFPASYGVGARQRLTSAEYDAYRGHLGHQHAPGNSHGDPGDIDMARLLRLAVGPTEPARSTYAVRAGDTLTLIAARYGLTWQQLAALNPTIDPDALRVGQVIVVPAGTPRPDPPKPEPDPPKPKPETAVVRFASTNIRDDTLASSKPYPWAKRRAGYVAAVKSTRPDAVLVQEATERQMSDLCAGLGPSWTWWRAADTARDDGPLAVAWNTDVLQRTDDGSEIELPSNRRGLRVPLRHEKSGKPFDAIVGHLDNNGGADRGPVRIDQARRLAEWLPGAVSKTEASPLIFGADLNDKRTGGTGPRAELRKAGLTFVRDAGVKVPGAEYESHHGGGALTRGADLWIDDIATRGVRLRGAGVVRTDRDAPVLAYRNVTDHVILWAEIDL